MQIPHGGPHTTSSTIYFMTLAFLCSRRAVRASLDTTIYRTRVWEGANRIAPWRRGFNLVIPNYRGSCGFGEGPLQSLPGKIGQQDVADCLAALDAAAQAGFADPSNTAVVGGSHGGECPFQRSRGRVPLLWVRTGHVLTPWYPPSRFPPRPPPSAVP